MTYYKSTSAFAYLLNNPLDSNEAYSFRGLTAENFIKECMIVPVRSIYVKTCGRFIDRLNRQCKVEENLRVLRQVFFMEAGH